MARDTRDAGRLNQTSAVDFQQLVISVIIY